MRREWELLPSIFCRGGDTMLCQGLVGFSESNVAWLYKRIDLGEARIFHSIGGDDVMGIEGLDPGTVQKVVVSSWIRDLEAYHDDEKKVRMK